ncbi:MAG TPA: hypothetical protein VJH22_04855 [Candidatus Nanoarchaeia archaeon]|nr:hypothetical protein [Candidatus Nanoarchaeia archaeon]
MTLKTTAILMLALLSLFWMASCGAPQQSQAPIVIEQPVPSAPIIEQAAPEQKPSEQELSLDEMLAKLKAPDAQATAEAQSYDQPSAPHSGPLPTTKKEACRATGLPSTYEACLNGCARTCGDISQAKCDEVEVPGQDQNFVCYSCSCS